MKPYQFFAVVSMIFAGLTAVVAKAGLKNVGADTGLAIRTCFVFVFVWLNFILFNSTSDFSNFSKKDILLLAISALTTSISWIFYYKALKVGNVSEVALIDKASILITILLSVFFLKENFSWKLALGASLMLSGLLVITWK